MLLIATLFGMMRHDETTKKIDKVRKQIRMFINRLDSKRLAVLIKETNASWEKVKVKTDDNQIGVSLGRTIVILYDLLEVKQLVVSEKNLEAAVRSLEYGYEITAKTEADTAMLTDYFREELGIEVRAAKKGLAQMIGLKMKIAEQNKILEAG